MHIMGSSHVHHCHTTDENATDVTQLGPSYLLLTFIYLTLHYAVSTGEDLLIWHVKSLKQFTCTLW